MARSTTFRPVRALCVLLALFALLFATIGGGVLWSSAQWTPKLALDLEGGTEIVLKPQLRAGAAAGSITQDTINEAKNIIQQRINGSGVSESEISLEGNNNLIVSLPGKPDKETRDAVTRAAAMEFRAVLVAAAATPSAAPTTSPGTGVIPLPSTNPTGAATLKPAPSSSVKVAPKTTSSNGMVIPRALLAATTAPAQPVTTAAPAAPVPAASPGAATAPQPKPTDASDPNWVTPELQTQFENYKCDAKTSQGGKVNDDLTKPLITCQTDGSSKYILGPAEVLGSDISSATAGLETTAQGFTGTAWQVNISFTGNGATKFGKVTQRLVGKQGDLNRFGIVLDGLVVSAPTTQAAILGGQAQITGNFTQAEAQSLANQLKFGALPVSFEVQTENEISATLGGEQLQRGLLAGLIGLLLVVLYSLLQYRALGAVTIASLTLAAGLTYGFVVLLGWRQGFRLSLSGVAGLIVSIGITADSFIVFFERVRDEVREGRALKAAVEVAWKRARRTILASDAVSLLAAIVLFLLAVGGVKGFAFTLGLTTVVDIIIVFLFTHPTVALLAGTKFFGGGHRLSGFDPVRLGRPISYAGRGRIRREPGDTYDTDDVASSELATEVASDHGLVPAEPARPGRPERASVPAGAGRSALKVKAEAKVGARPAGGTIAERRAAREKAERDLLSSEPGAGGASDDQDAPDSALPTSVTPQRKP